MTNDQITALTLLLLHTHGQRCVCEFMSYCSRCYALGRAEEQFPLVYEAFTNTMEKMEAAK